jgi:IclR family acetate operon transcriptional repressor
VDDAEFQQEVRCLAAPIRDKDGAVVAAIGISAPLTRFPRERCAVCARQVVKAAKEIGTILSARSPR